MHQDFDHYAQLRQSTTSPSLSLFDSLGGQGVVEHYRPNQSTSSASPPPTQIQTTHASPPPLKNQAEPQSTQLPSSTAPTSQARTVPDHIASELTQLRAEIAELRSLSLTQRTTTPSRSNSIDTTFRGRSPPPPHYDEI